MIKFSFGFACTLGCYDIVLFVCIGALGGLLLYKEIKERRKV